MSTATLTKAVRKLLSEVEGKAFNIDFKEISSTGVLTQSSSSSSSSSGSSTSIIKNTRDLTLENKRIISSVSQAIEMQTVEVDGVHRVLPNVKHHFESTKGLDKLIYLKSVLEKNHSRMKRTLIFCNTIKSCQAVELYLKELNNPIYLSEAINGESSSSEREINLKKFRAGDINILVSTDIASRGLDIPEIDHVILFDFPLNPIDYIHRAGRCGRAGRKGTVTSILIKRDLVLALAIQGAMERNLPIDNLSSSKKDYLPGGRLAHILGRKNLEDKIKQYEEEKKSMTPKIIAEKRAEFQRKQQEIVRENPKYMKNALPGGRRGRVIAKNPKLITPTLKKTSRFPKPSSSSHEDDDDDDAGFEDNHDLRSSSSSSSGSKSGSGGNTDFLRPLPRGGKPSSSSKNEKFSQNVFSKPGTVPASSGNSKRPKYPSERRALQRAKREASNYTSPTKKTKKPPKEPRVFSERSPTESVKFIKQKSSRSSSSSSRRGKIEKAFKSNRAPKRRANRK
jgi:superfamily II DNA/RNA helicase